MQKHELVRNYAQSMEIERVRLNLTQNEMAKKLDMSLSNYKKIISGESSTISLYVTHLMHELTGKWTCELCNEHNEELEILEKYRLLSSSQRNFINAILDIEAELSQDTESEEDYISVFVPTGNMEDGMVYDSSNLIHVNAASYKKKFGDFLHYGLKITSSYLQPVYNPGDILLICKSPARDGDTGVFFNKSSGRVYFRKLHQSSSTILLPVNNYGSEIEIGAHDDCSENNWINFGRVLCKMRI